MDNDGEWILKEQETLRCLLPRTNKKLIEKLVYYTFETYSMYPTAENIIQVSNAAVEIFDKLKDDQGGIVSKFNLM